MKKNIFSVLAVAGVLAIAVNAFASGNTIYVDASAPGPTHDGLSTTTAFTTIQAAIDDANTHDGDKISIADGTYTITTTIEVNKELTLQGTTETGTIIDTSAVTSGLFGPFGIHSGKSNTTYSNFTLKGPTGSGGRGMKLEGLTPSTTRATNVNITNVTVENCKKTGIDLNGIDNATLTGVTLTNNGANGFSLTDGNNLTLTNVTTSGNAWGGIALYTNGVAYTGGISGVTITGLNASETNPLYVQIQGSNPADSGNPYKATGISAPQFTYTGTNSLNTGSQAYTFYGTNPVTVLANATAAGDAAHATVKDASGNTVVVTGQTIQSRIDAATTSDVIVVPAGSYTENLTINKAITLKGANAGVSAVTGTRSAESILTGNILITAGSVTVDGMKITNPSYSGSSIKGIQVYSSGPTISAITLKNNIISNIANGAAHGSYGIMIQGDVSGVTIDSNKIDSISSAGWARGIEVTAGCNVANVPAAVTVTNNQITNISVSAGTDVYSFTIDWCDSPVKIADASQVTLTGNQFDIGRIRNLDKVHPLVVSKNWWGSTGPDFNSATGTITNFPWCMDSACLTLVAAPPTAAGGGGTNISSGGSTTTAASSTTGTLTGTTTIPTTITGTTSTATTTPTIGGQVLGVSIFKFLKNLFYGSRGNDVSELQKMLIANGYLKLKTGLPTGWFGPLTRAALANWQKANAISPANGYFGPISRAKLNQ